MTHWAIWLAFAAGAYLVGSIPFGLLIARARGVDIRQHGSRNIGATNVARVLGKPWGVLCFALDVAKGAAPTLAAGFFTGVLGHAAASSTSLLAWLGVASAAMAGHIFPIWLRFKGGKGVATGLGAVASIYPGLTLPALAGLAVWGIVVLATRYVSLASIVAALSIPPFAALLIALHSDRTAEGVLRALAQQWPVLAVACVLGALVVWRHRANIARLRDGTESRIGRKPDYGNTP